MSVFDFTLLSGYEFSGVDVAQGFRARLFAKNNVNAKFIFTELPTIRDMELYGSQKIKRGQIMSAHLFMTGRLDMSLSVKKEALLENEKENYEYDNIDEDGKVIRLYNSGEKSVEILCDEDGFVINESLFKNGKKYLVNYYTDSLSYTELYNWDNDSNDGLNLGRRIFWNKQGQMVYEQCIYKDNVEYLFKNGEVIDNVEFLERFVKALNLCENDICIMDRAGYLDYIQPLFENKGKSKLIAVLHSDHFYKIYEDESSLYMNYEYYYWFKYSEAIDYFVVGTDEHKRSLEAFLKEYDCFVPHIAAIPPGAIPEGKLKSKNNRRRGSIISASRLSPRKGIDILIKSVIKAHELNQIINLDIYGSGDDGYTIYLKNIVKDACADDYIYFKGRCNLEKIYPHYQLFASFSLWETFGLSLMEAVGDGLAMVGLDVRYGNRLFIHPDENGYLVDFDIETDYQNKDKLCERTAAAIVKIFEDDDRLKKFHENSYMIAEEYKEHVIESKWMQLIAFFIRCAGLEDTAVYFNSLSYPFFASQALAPNGFRDALFWHEPVGDEIPGNMQIILHDQGTRAKRVFVSRRESYDRLIALGAPSDKVKQLGYIYSFVRENKHRPHILVCTNSENVGHLTELASLMPQMHFHVAAITEMSSKLMSAGQYDNVSLYPNVKMSVLDSLFEKCDFYLDINHEGEIVDAVHRAFLNNMLIVGYEETMHNAYYTADTNTFKESEYADMAEALNLTLAMPHLIDEALAMQKKAAVAADATDYMEILHL